MSTGDPAQRAALMRLGASTAEAIAQVLEMFAPGEVNRGEVSVLASKASPFASLEAGSVAASVSYVDGVTGANVFVAPRNSARALAAKMGVPPEDGAEELSELELSAISEAANQMMAAAASAIGVVLGQEIEISPPTTRVIDDPGTADELFGSAPHATSTTFMVGGEPCRLIQLIPSAFVVRIARALDEMNADSKPLSGENRGRADNGEVTLGLTEALSGIKLRVWAELGRSVLPLGDALELPLGAVVELDRATEAPVDLYVNGLRFAHGRLLVSDDGRWVFALDELLAGQTNASLSAVAVS